MLQQDGWVFATLVEPMHARREQAKHRFETKLMQTVTPLNTNVIYGDKFLLKQHKLIVLKSLKVRYLHLFLEHSEQVSLSFTTPIIDLPV